MERRGGSLRRVGGSGADVDGDVADEIGFHIEGVVEELVSEGWSPGRARAEALRRFGDVERVAAECVGIDRQRLGRQRRWLVIREFVVSLGHGVRALRRSPSFAAVAILTLALGIGATTAIFTVVNGVLLRPLPFADPDRLYMVWERNAGQGIDRDNPSAPNFLDWRESSRSFAGMAAWRDESMTLTGLERAEVLEVAGVTANLFDVLGVEPVAGRGFVEGEDLGGGSRVVVVSHAVWQRLFGGDRSVLGRTLVLDGTPYEIVGVMPASFRVPRSTIAVWMPFDGSREHRQTRYLEVVARLGPGVTAAQAESELRAVGARLARLHPEANEGFEPYLVKAHDQVVGDARSILLFIFGAVGFVLVLACTNVASLVLSRATTRESELAVRTAMGATGSRLRLQLVAENLILALAAGALGAAFAYWGVRLFLARAPGVLPRGQDVVMDMPVLGFAFLTAITAGIVLGLVPSWRASRVSVTDLLRDGSPRSTAGRSRETARRLLIVGEVTVALVLLIGAGLAIRSFEALRAVDPGYRTEHVLAARVNLSGARYDAGPMAARNERKSGYFEAILERIRALPGVTAAGVTSSLPLSPAGIDFDLPYHAEGQPRLPENQAAQVDYRIVSPGYLGAMGIRLVSGRDFDRHDRVDSRPVLLVNESFAERHWPGEDPVGKVVTLFYVEDTGWEVVGVVADTRHRGLSVPPRAQVFVPLGQAQFLFGYMTLVVRTEQDVPGLVSGMQDAAAAIDPEEPLYDFETIETLLADATARDRLAALVLAVFALIAIGLSAAGIYGVVSFQVASRTREIGVRMALGASRGRVLGSVIGEAVGLAGLGIALGLAGGIAASRLAADWLHGVGPRDPATFATVSVLLLSVALVAAAVPARRAASVAPLEALRVE